MKLLENIYLLVCN